MCSSDLLPAPVGGIAASATANGPARLSGSADADEPMIDLANVEGQLRASSIRRIADIVEQHPEESLSIVRSWLQQEAA